MVIVNGKEIEFKENTTIIGLLNQYNLKEDRVVVEVNLNIVKEDDYDSYILNEEDRIEIISFVGGG